MNTFPGKKTAEQKVNLFCCRCQVLKDEEMLVIDQAVGFRQRMNERPSQFFMIYIDLFRAAQTRGDFRGSSWLSCRESLGNRVSQI